MPVEASSNPKKGRGRKKLDDDQRVPGTPLEADTPMEQEADKPSNVFVGHAGDRSILKSTYP